MGWKRMTPAPVNEGDQKQFAFEETQALAAVAAGDWILVPDDVRLGVSVTVTFTASAAGKVQTTTDSVAAVKAGTATAVDWPAGAVTATTQDAVIAPITAIRANQTSIGGGSGTMTMTVRAQ